MKKVLGGWWFLSILAAVLAILALAVLLPLAVGLLRPLWVRLVIILVILAIWGGLTLWRVLSARGANDRMAEALVAPAGDAESETLTARMKEALGGLKTASGNKRDYLYSRPWYVIIGPPGAGKTTALVNSGLRFPFADTALKGAGGTRNLDFWFADEAVLVDTAGRYTTQDSEAERDKGGWNAFLQLLKKNRPLSPVNGVLVVIGLDELMGANVAKVDAHAHAVRRRLQELNEGLEVSSPVYVLFSKADLLAGFTEFFDDLDVEGRRAVLGSTLPWGPRPTAEALGKAFDEVEQAVEDRTSRRLQDDLDARRRGLIVGFPAQVEALRSRVLRLLDGMFPTEATTKAAALRGFYFTSGVQQGAPLDRILGGMAQVYDAPAQPVQGAGRAYFINRLLNEVVIPEAGLVQSSPAARRRRTTQLIAGCVAVGLVTLVVGVLWTISFFSNRDFQQRLLAGSVNATQAIRSSGIDLVEVRASDTDLEGSLSALRALRNLPRGYEERHKGGTPLNLTFGLYQSGESRAAEQAYLEGLQRIMLPRIMLRLERYLRDHSTDPLSLYQPLKIYLMLGGLAPHLDKGAVKSWVEGDWANELYPGGDREPTRKELAQHLDAMLADPQFGADWPDRKAPLDGALVASSRSAVQTLSLADRAYAVLKQKAASLGKPGWSAATVLSSGDAHAFASGDAVRSLSVPYLFTREGYSETYLNGLNDIQGDLDRDIWVLGDDKNSQSIRAQISQVRPGVAGHYAQDYTEAWRKVIAGLQPADVFNDPAAFGAATGTPSPLKLVLLEVLHNTEQLSQGTTKSNFTAKLEKDIKNQAVIKLNAPGAVGSLLSGQLNGQGVVNGVDAAATIGAAFEQLVAYVGDGKTPAPIDDFVNKLRAAVTAKGTADRARQMGAIGGGGDAAQADVAKAMSELAAVSTTAPPLVQSFVSAASKAGDKAQVTAATGAVTSAWTDQVGPQCKSVTEQRYPFVTASQADAPVGDLLRVLGANGVVDSFVSQRLRPMLDTAGPIWRWNATDPVAQTFDPTSAGEFQKTADIRDVLLSGVSVKIEAAGFGGATTAAEISAGGQTYKFEPSQAGQRPLQWTNSSLPEAHVTLFNGATPAKTFSFEGPWALFRLMDAAKKENAGPTAFKATFGDGANFVTFRVVLASEKNPFSRGGMWSFRCPPKL